MKIILSDLDDVNELLNLGKGDQGRLEHIKTTLESNKTLFESDKAYLQQLVDENISKKTESTIHTSKNDTNKEFCGKCGTEISDKSNSFCSKCGSPRNVHAEAYCGKCGQKIHNNTPCPNCQNYSPRQSRLQRPVEWKSESTTLVLSIILGLLGIQGVGHFYVGKIGKGVAYLIGSLVVLIIGIGLTITGIGAVVGIPLLIVYFVMFLFQILDSRKLCRYYNDYLEENNKAPW